MQYVIGDDRYGHLVLPKSERKTILLLSDDMRTTSGIATMTREFVMGTVHRFNYINVGALVKHPERGKMIDLSDDISDKTGVPDCDVKVLPWNGYGEPDLIRQLLSQFDISAILHFTDPRYWVWLYDMEHEIRQHVPILYYTIWDNVGYPPDFAGDPTYNATYYASCDGLFCISKQTYGMVNRVVDAAYGDDIKKILL